MSPFVYYLHSFSIFATLNCFWVCVYGRQWLYLCTVDCLPAHVLRCRSALCMLAFCVFCIGLSASTPFLPLDLVTSSVRRGQRNTAPVIY